MYALSGALIAYTVFDFHPNAILYTPHEAPGVIGAMSKVMLLGTLILILAAGTAIALSSRNLWHLHVC
jgi:hypothetical protein